MKWEILAKKQLAFYIKKDDYLSDLRKRLHELEGDVSFPVTIYDYELGRIYTASHSLEDEVIRREMIREQLESSISRINKKASSIKQALDSMSSHERILLMDYSRSQYKPGLSLAFENFYWNYVINSTLREKADELKQLKSLGMENTQRFQRIKQQLEDPDTLLDDLEIYQDYVSNLRSAKAD